MIYAFDRCEVDLQNYELRYQNNSITVGPKVFDLLVYLLEHRDRVVTRQELFDHLWPDQFISDWALTRCVSDARKAIGDEGGDQQIIRTVYGRGYRFMMSVEVHGPSPEDETSTSPDDQLRDDLPQDERKFVTVLVGALSDVTGLYDDLSPEGMHHLVHAFFELAWRLVAQYGGVISSYTDSGFTALFGAPFTHEDHARRALLCAQAIQRLARNGELAAYERPGKSVRVGLGVHSGYVAARQIAEHQPTVYITIGNTMWVAGQLLQQVAAGDILLSDATLDGVQTEVEVARPTSRFLSGSRTPIAIHRLLQVKPTALPIARYRQRSLTPFVGREPEISTLHTLLEQVRQGQGHAVGVVGEPGLGKSRLLYEFRQRLQSAPITYIAGQCVSYHSATPYFPLQDALRRHLGVQPSDAAAIVTTKLTQALAALDMASEARSPYLLHMLGIQDAAAATMLNPPALKRQTFDALSTFIVNTSQQRPLVLEIENAHWIDSTSEEWLASLVTRLVGIPVLLLLTYRPGYPLPWVGKSYTTQISLSLLSRADSQRVVQQAAKNQALTTSAVDEIVAKASGNPFFLEELTQTTDDHSDESSSLFIPATVQAVLSSRIDRLPAESKGLLQVAAVIGKDIPLYLLRALTELSDETLYDTLVQLQDAEFIYMMQATPEPVYTFKHALTRDVTYQSLLQSVRQRHHQRLTEVMETQFPDIAAMHPELLAHHFHEAGQPTQAIVLWQRAAQRALDNLAHRDAMIHIQRGLNVLASIPDTAERLRHELTLQTMQGVALAYTKGYTASEVVRAFDRAHQLSERVGNPYQLFTVLRGAWLFYLMRSEIKTAAEIGKHLFHLAQEYNDSTLLVEAKRAIGTTLLLQGNQTDATMHLASGLALYDAQHPAALDIHYGQDTGIMLLLYSGWNLWLRGYPNQALQTIEQMLKQSQHRTPYHRRHASIFSAFAYQWTREVDVVQQRVQASIAVADQHALPAIGAIGTIFQGWVLAQQGKQEAGIAMICQGITDYRALGAELGVPYKMALLSEVYLHARALGEGLRTVSEALTLAEQSGERWWEAELYRLRAELLWRQTPTNTTKVETDLRHALDLAHRQQARSLELRAAMSLAHFWQSQDKRQEAYSLLAPIYNWFTEGFDTHDLQDARKLLATLT